MKLLFNNGNQHVSGDGAPDLRLYCILAVADKSLDTQMLLDPLEKQFDLPSLLVQCGDGQRGQRRIVGQEYQRLAGFRVFETDAPQLFGVAFRGLETVQRDELIADDSRTPIDLHRVHPVCIHTPFRPSHENAPAWWSAYSRVKSR